MIYSWHTGSAYHDSIIDYLGVLCLKKKLCALTAAVLLFACLFCARAGQYIVKTGDTLWGIAQNNLISVEELLAINPQIANPNALTVGQVVQIPEKAAGAAPEGRESLTYLYAGSSTSYLKILSSAQNSIRTVCPDYFDINPDGSLLITTANKVDPVFIQRMHSAGILVTPFLTNNWVKQLGNAALDNRESLSSEIAAMIEQNGLDGVNVDIQNVNEQYRQRYTDFTRLLRRKLPPDKLVTVAVAANPKGWTTGWHGSYDYKALSDQSDYLMLMTYDESYYGGPAGPVSSRTFFEDSIKYALNQGVPKTKIVAGIPFFGRYWKEGASVGGYGITVNDVEHLIEHYSCEEKYDEAQASAHVIVTIRDSDTKPVLWGGLTLSAGTYHIWYDNLVSVRSKLDIVNSYDLRGAGSWALGEEDADIWGFYSDVLNGRTVTVKPPPPPSPAPAPKPAPAPGPAAGPPSAPDSTKEELPPAQPPLSEPKPAPKRPNTERVLSTLNRKGNPRKVTLASKLTRGEMAVLLAEISFVKPEAEGVTFKDTKSHWAKGEISALKRRGIMRGNQGLFNPDKTMSREEAAALLDRILVLPKSIDYNAEPFSDVSPKRWSFKSISNLNYFGLLKGKSKTKFAPTDPITAGQMALILDRIDKYGYPMNPDKYMDEQPDGTTSPKADIKEPAIQPR